MLYFIFTYNIFLIVLYTIAATAFFFSYLRRKKPIDGWVASLFALFIIDNSIIYMTEIITGSFEVFSNAVKGLILCAFLLCYGQGFKRLFHARFTTADYVCYAVYVAAIIITPSFTTASRFAVWLYLAYVWMMLCYVFSRAYQESKKSISVYTDLTRLKVRLMYISAIAFVAAAMLENWIKVFFAQETFLFDEKVYTRNISEDLYSVYVVALALWYLLAKTFGSDTNPQSAPAIIGGMLLHGNNLEAFAIKYKMTPRETEVLSLLVIGRTNQQISEALFISLGTAKNHVHNIYRKCDVAKRSQLLKLIDSLS